MLAPAFAGKAAQLVLNVATCAAEILAALLPRVIRTAKVFWQDHS